MGYWFGVFDKRLSWRKKTPVKIYGKWYTPKGEKVRDSDAYFKTIERNGRYWEGNIGWSKKNKKILRDHGVFL
ncbi:hypothetical protein J422_04590 [Methanocaldococcus villosus KIN24-T80]|uniref:Uncharacterized protein n=1 Tax=Methanocaldococcus villosus KIN24-T80 TaxID=1069083 RepID=N6V174_9EURY|nr:hypothetical protein [Methanocaldococcus villosus]ENN96033.1 hypothetical protein J422_04590 [Methanocaldococcus villosus KIN24-T80]